MRWRRDIDTQRVGRIIEAGGVDNDAALASPRRVTGGVDNDALASRYRSSARREEHRSGRGR